MEDIMAGMAFMTDLEEEVVSIMAANTGTQCLQERVAAQEVKHQELHM